MVGRLDIDEITARVPGYTDYLAQLKARTDSGLAWYPYDSLGSIFELSKLLTSEWRFPLDLIAGEPVLDVACADGDVAFFLESLGCRVEALDWPSTNFNRMGGIRALRQALGSSVKIREMDLDSQFTLQGRYGMAFFLGALYHLKNPFYVLETLARHARYCVLSTRIARHAPDGMNIRDLPVAYLLDGGEANRDTTNFWVFSEAGLRRLLARTRWGICRFLTLGNTDRSDPASGEGDERAFCLLRSRFIRQQPHLLEGWHSTEPGGWRWTERRFAVAFHGEPRSQLRLHFVLPEPLLAQLGPMTLAAQAAGQVLPARTYADAGEHLYLATLPPAALASDPVRVEFQLDKALAPNAADRRELGIVVASIELD